MKIGIMLRHYGQHGGGVRVYTQNLIRELARLDTPHEFLLIYRDPRFIGTHANGGRVREIAVGAPSVFLWDQLAVPRIARKEQLDILFNPKYSVPLMGKCPCVFVCHGLDWYVMPWGSKWIDGINYRYLMRLYAKKSRAIIAVSNTAGKHAVKYLNKDPDQIHTIYLGVDDIFRKPASRERLQKVKNQYGLPERFFLFVGQIYPPKNFGRLIRAYAKVGPQMGISLVVAGEHRWLCSEELALVEKLGLSSWVVRPGWIDQETLPSLYALAQALLLPSLYEACPSPPIEAMASGCPVVTANRYGTEEIAGRAAILVNPDCIDDIAEGMKKVILDQEVRSRIIEAGIERASGFSWEKCAMETMAVLQKVAFQYCVA